MALGEGKLTQAGLRLVAKVPAGVKIELTRFTVGDGEIGNRDPLQLTDLIHRLYEYPVAHISYTNNAATVTFNFTNQIVTTGFYWRELGVWAKDPDVGEILFMYASSGSVAPEFIPAGGSTTILERRFNWRLITSNASSITAKIDESLLYASQNDLADLDAHSLRTRKVDPSYTELNQFLQPGIYYLSQVSGYTDKPVYENGTNPSGNAILVVKRDIDVSRSALTQSIEIMAGPALHVYSRRIVINTTNSVGSWIRQMNAQGGSFTGTVNLDKGANVTGIMNVNSATPLVLRNGTTNRRWVSHLELPSSAQNNGGRLHISPSTSIDKDDWDFAKGLSINADTGAVFLKNGLEGGLFLNGKAWADAKPQFGSPAQMSVTIGDSDSGLNWESEGVINLVGNGQIAARINGGKFEIRNADGSWSKVGAQKYTVASGNLQYQDGAERIYPYSSGNNIIYTHKFQPKALGEVRVIVDTYGANGAGTALASHAGVILSIGDHEGFGSRTSPFSDSSTDRYLGSGFSSYLGSASNGWVTRDVTIKVDRLSPVYFFIAVVSSSVGATVLGMRNLRVYYDVREAT